MKTVLTTVWSYLITPLLLGAYWYTQHTAWLYVFGVLSVITIIAGVVFAAVVWKVDEATLERAASEHPISAFRLYSGGVYQVATVVFLLWNELWTNATLFLIAMGLLWPVMFVFREAARNHKEKSHVN